MKICEECGVEKPAARFYCRDSQPDGLSPRCKVCHNGTTAWNARRAGLLLHRQPGDPSEDQIAAACAAIRSRWSRLKREARRRKAVSR